MSQPIQIVSTGRTGTVFFSQLFNDLYPEVAAYHERGCSRPMQILTNAHYAGLLPKRGVTFAWKSLKESEILNCEKTFHLDANCFLYGLNTIAPELITDVKVIHIVRDPRTYVTSHLNFARFRTTSFIANYLTPFWQPSPFLTREISWKKYFSLSRLERYAWIWNFKNAQMDLLEETSIPYLRVRFEDVFYSENPEATFAKMTNFIGLPRKENIKDRFFHSVNKAPKKHFFEWQTWSAEQAVSLDMICGERMKKYGYGSESTWLEKLEK